MVFADFLDLRTAALEEVGRTDLADVFPRLTLMAEAAFNRRLRLRQQMTTTTLVMTNGAAAMPNDWEQIIGVYDGQGREYEARPVQAVRGCGCFYALDDNTLVSGSLSSELRLDYYASIPTITGNMTGSNWLLQRYPEVYLYGVGFQIAKHIGDRERAADMAGLLSTAYTEAERDSNMARYARARVRVSGVTP